MDVARLARTPPLPRATRLALKTVLAAAVGVVVAFPLPAVIYLERHGHPAGELGLGFWALLALGPIGGAAFVWSKRLSSRRRRLFRRGMALVSLPFVAGWLFFMWFVIEDVFRPHR